MSAQPRQHFNEEKHLTLSQYTPLPSSVSNYQRGNTEAPDDVAKRIPQAIKDQARALVEAGRSATATAEVLGLIPSTVNYWVKQYGWSRGSDLIQPLNTNTGDEGSSSGSLDPGSFKASEGQLIGQRDGKRTLPDSVHVAANKRLEARHRSLLTDLEVRISAMVSSDSALQDAAGIKGAPSRAIFELCRAAKDLIDLQRREYGLDVHKEGPPAVILIPVKDSSIEAWRASVAAQLGINESQVRQVQPAPAGTTTKGN